MRVAITGSRRFRRRDFDVVTRVVDSLLISGHAIHVGRDTGVDAMVAEAFRYRCPTCSGERLKVYEGASADASMIAESEMLIALFAPGRRSSGTAQAIDLARKAGLAVYVYYDGKWTE